MSIRFPGKTEIDPRNPEAVGICDRCGKIFNLERLRGQPQWAGTQVINRSVRICARCEDTPNEQMRALRIDPDPDPIRNARWENFALDEKNFLTLAKVTGFPFVFYGQGRMTAELAVAGAILEIVADLAGVAALEAALSAGFGLSAELVGVSDVLAALQRGQMLDADFAGVSGLASPLARGLMLAPSFDGLSDLAAVPQYGARLNPDLAAVSDMAGDLTQVVWTPASYVFNGVDEYMRRVLSTSGASTTICTISLWSKAPANAGGYVFAMSWNAVNSNFFSRFVATPTEQLMWQTTDGSGVLTNQCVTAADQYEENNTWHHYVCQYDSTQGTTADRLRIYRDGSQIADTQAPDIALNEVQQLFRNGNSCDLGSIVGAFFANKMAFIDVLEGVSAAPTAFAFNSGGTWTRMPYAGSYGTYGFSLDGTAGFNDTSGNGQNFTGVNMNSSNLDPGDVPPFIPG